jgi:coatomer subunit beta'
MKVVHNGETARKGQNNLAFASLLQLGDAKACVDLLVKTDRAPEAALFARTYAPRCVLLVELFLCSLTWRPSSSQVPQAVAAWKGGIIAGGKKKLAGTIADPSENAELFEEGWVDALAREQGERVGPTVNGISRE